jgi:hypothetical protein
MYDIFPKSVFTGKNEDGSKFSMFEYDYGSYTNLTIFNSFYGIFIFAILGSMVSPLVYLFGVLTYRASFSFLFLVTFIVSGYAAYDIWNDWLLFKCLAIFFPNYFLLFLFKINFAVSVSSLVLLLTPTIIKASNSFFVYLSVLLISFYIGYNIAGNYNEDKPDWIDRNINEEKYEVSPIDKMTPEEFEKYENERYEKEIRERNKIQGRIEYQ